jgi:hypothetical protein
MTQLSLLDKAKPKEPPEPPSEIKVVKCKSCGDPIAFVPVGRKIMPVNLDVHYVSDNGHGKRMMLVSLEGKIIQGFECKPKEAGARPGRMSHFATCPNAAEHRRQA